MTLAHGPNEMESSSNYSQRVPALDARAL
jgi:hypothetical protein